MDGLLHITVCASLRPSEVREWLLLLPAGASVADALLASGIDVQEGELACGIWGRAAELHECLRHGDRVECCRPLTVDPKLARRRRFASQGARAAGLFAKRRGSKQTF